MCQNEILVCCISSYSYIKPQQTPAHGAWPARCISSYSYIKPQRWLKAYGERLRCISSYSYIKPQPVLLAGHAHQVVYHPIPTSNHNDRDVRSLTFQLYIILFLHQTTTAMLGRSYWLLLYIILFLHQTTTLRGLLQQARRCISSYSYIKPQLRSIFALYFKHLRSFLCLRSGLDASILLQIC